MKKYRFEETDAQIARRYLNGESTVSIARRYIVTSATIGNRINAALSRIVNEHQLPKAGSIVEYRANAERYLPYL